jgi:5-methylcytosine-specific restriction endonuclease McrA
MQTETRFKRGDVREDGMVFWEYKKQRKKSEYWVSEQRFAEMRSKNLLSGKKYRESDRERYRMLKRSQFKAAKEKDPEKFKETRKITHEKYRKRNRERLLLVNRERMQKWRTENPELAKAMQNKWIQNNKHRFIAYNSKQRARRKSQTSILDIEERLTINEIYKARKRISDCTGIQFHVDHIYPLSKGGVHKLSNLQLLPAIINIKKGNKLPCSP